MVGLFLAGPRDRPELGGISIPWSRGGRLTGAPPPPPPPSMETGQRWAERAETVPQIGSQAGSMAPMDRARSDPTHE